MAPADASLKLESPDGFPVRSALAVLRVGSKEFDISEISPDKQVLLFSATAEELAALNEGDEIVLHHGDSDAERWTFGQYHKPQ